MCYRYVRLARTIYIRCIYGIAGNSPNIRSYTVHLYGSGQPYRYAGGAGLRVVTAWTVLGAAFDRQQQLTSNPPLYFNMKMADAYLHR